MKVKSY